uniref:Polygalacturonate 4-alpha-galacturonosyltransferase n=1 Tax=Opuntia streptacantha TaxID=393608 RepID=A0A7C9AG04_OPUST
MAIKRGLLGTPTPRTRTNASWLRPSAVVAFFFVVLLLPLVFFVARGLYLSESSNKSGGSFEQNVDWRQRLAVQHLKSFLSKEDVNVISANVKDLGPLSLDTFKRNNGSASWKVVGQENLGDTPVEAKSKETYGKQDSSRSKQGTLSGHYLLSVHVEY